MRFALVSLLGMLASGGAAAQSAAALPGRGDAFVAMTAVFAFYSDPVTSLHDFLLWNAISPEPVEPAHDCFAALPADQRAAFEHARAHYAATFVRGGEGRVLLALRWRLAQLGEFAVADPAVVTATLAELTPARPAYEACWWRAHDARNRLWVASMLPLLIAHENALRQRLADLYGSELATPIAVDVVGYAGFGGASSAYGPNHIYIAAGHPDNAGLAGIEVLFHEASHTLFGPGLGPVWDALREAAIAANTQLPREFWHALLFFITGEAMRRHLAEQGIPDYVPYLDGEGWLDEGEWASFRAPLEAAWRPYVDGRSPLAEAATRTAAAFSAPAR